MLDLKKWMTKVVTWIKAPIVTGTSGDIFYKATRSDVNVSVGLGVGAGGTNHGVWSYKLGKWLIYGDGSKVYVNNIPFDTQAQTLTALGKSWYFTRIGRVVYIDAPNDTTVNVSAGNNTIGTLNSGLRPTAIQYLKCTNVNADVRLVINTNGTVQLYSASAWTGAHNCGFSGYCYLAST